MNILERIKKLASSKNLTIPELEELANIPEGTINNCGGEYLPSGDRLQRVATVLGVSIYYLVNGYEQPEEELIISSPEGMRLASPEEIKILRRIINDIKRENV